MEGNTSTHVEKTDTGSTGSRTGWKHLHARGENLPVLRFMYIFFRNTSTHVEKTKRRLANALESRKHLHARGENTKNEGTLASK